MNQSQSPQMLFEQFQVKLKPREVIMVLGLFYILQGSIFGYVGAMSVVFQTEGISLSQQGTLSYTTYPFVLKIFFAPFLDVYFLPKIGKRKTYIFISGLMMSSLLLGTSSFINEVVLSTNVTLFTVICFTIVFFLAINDVSIDAIANSLLPEEHVHHSSTAQTAGQIIGILFGYVGFSYLNDMDWLNSYIFKEDPLTSPLMSSCHMFVILGFYSLGISMFVFFFVYEPLRHDSSLKSPLDSYKLYFCIFKNKKLLLLTFWMVFYYFGFAFESATISYKFLDAGMTRAFYVSLSLLTYPIYLLSTIGAALIVKKGTFLRWNNFLNWVSLVLCPVFLVLLYNYETQGSTTKLMTWFIILNVLSTLISQNTLLQGMYVSWAAQAEYSSAFKTYFYSIMNTSSDIPSTIALKIVGYFDYYWFCVVGLVIQAFILIGGIWLSRYFDALNKEDLYLKVPESAFAKLPQESAKMENDEEDVSLEKMSRETLNKAQYEI